MTNSKIISNINGFTAAQEVEFNLQSTKGKIHNTEQQMISNADRAVAQDTESAVALLSQSEIDSAITPFLNDSSQLSGWPC